MAAEQPWRLLRCDTTPHTTLTCAARQAFGDSPQGEELTLDYGQETESEKEHRAAVCLCGADACRGSFLTYNSHAAGQAQPQQQVNANEVQPQCVCMWQRSSARPILPASWTLVYSEDDMQMFSNLAARQLHRLHHLKTQPAVPSVTLDPIATCVLAGAGEAAAVPGPHGHDHAGVQPRGRRREGGAPRGPGAAGGGGTAQVCASRQQALQTVSTVSITSTAVHHAHGTTGIGHAEYYPKLCHGTVGVSMPVKGSCRPAPAAAGGCAYCLVLLVSVLGDVG